MQILVISPQGYQRDALCCLLAHLFPSYQFRGLSEQSALDELETYLQLEEGLVISTQSLPLLDKRLKSSQQDHLIVSPKASTETLTNALRHILNSEEEMATSSVSVFKAQESYKPHLIERLTPRQRKVLSLMMEGVTSKEIAKKLNLSPSTIKTHLSAIFRVFQVRTRLQLMLATQRLH